MGKKQKKVNNREAKTQVVKAKRKYVNKRHKNGLYSDAELTEGDKQSELYKGYINVKSRIPRCKRFLLNEKNKKDLPEWGKIELEKVTKIMQERDRKKYNNNKQAIIKRQANYDNAHKPEKKDYYNAHKVEYSQYRQKRYKRAIENIKKIRNGKIDELSNEQLLSVQSLMKVIHKGKYAHSIHGLNLGAKDNNDIYNRNNLSAFKNFLKSQVGLDTVSQIDFTELNNMPFGFNELGDEGGDIFNNSYFNDQPINEQEGQIIDKYGFPTYGYNANGLINNKLFALNNAHNINGQSM